MKKLLLSFAACLMAFTMASAADITVDFSAAVDAGQLPAAESEELSTASIEGVNFTFYCCKGTGYQGANYLMVSGKKYEGAYVEFTVPQATKSFTLTTGSSASVSVTVQLSANGTNIGEAVKLDAKGADFKFDIPEANQAAGTVYRLTVTNKYNAQITKMVFTDTATTTPEEPETPAGLDESFTDGIPATWTSVTVAGDKDWYSRSFNDVYYACASGYKGTAPFDAWLISPAVDLDKAKEKVLTFRTQVNGYGSTTTTLKAYVLTSNDPTTAELTELKPTLAVAPESGYSEWVESGNLSLAEMKGVVYIGFRYEATEDANYATWCVTDVKLNAGNAPVEPEPEVVKAKSIKDVIALEAKTKFVAEFAMTVGWVNNRNVFVCDEAGDFIQIYGNNALKVGDVIPAGLEGTYDLYNGTPEIINANIPEATAGTFEPKVVAAADITTAIVNSVVTVNDVVLADATPADRNSFTGVSAGVELTFFNSYSLESVAAGTYNVTVVVTIYNNAPSLNVISYKTSTGVADINAANNAPVEYFNLQGVRVANPENGLYIRRQGANVQKVMVR